jgi:hypothetical protein
VFDHVGLNVRDYGASRDFYRNNVEAVCHKD